MSHGSDPSEGGSPLSSLALAGDRPLQTQMAIIFLARTVLNTSQRIIYPFLPSIARGLGISLAAASGLVTLRVVAGLAAPLFGPFTDRQGRRRSMELGLLLFTLASLLLVGSGFVGIATLVLAAAAFLLYGFAKVLYDPAVHGYLGDVVPYRTRGRAIGLIELSWSSAWLIGVPISGFLIERFDWFTPWLVMIGLGLLSLGLTRAFLPPGGTAPGATAQKRVIVLLTSSWRSLLRRRQVVLLLLVSMLLTMALEIPFIVYGGWLETSFGLGLSTLGLASIAVGLAEAFAEVGTTLLTDRLGKRRSVLAGLSGLAVSLLVLPLLADLGLVAALSGIVLVILCFEFAIVSLLPLVTELAPKERSSLLSLNVTAFSLGRIAGAALGGWLWTWSTESIRSHAAVGAVCAFVAALLVFRGMTDIEA
jgi:predicted MFS family arabinose efflux permease